MAGQFVANVDTAIVNVATPSIGETLHASGAELQLTVSCYVLAMAMLLITSARLGTLYGYRRLFIAGLSVFTVASLACGLAPNATTLIIARIVQGVGASLMVAQVITGIQRMFTGKERGGAIGAYTITLSLSAVLGQILGGVLVTANLFGTAWRPIFLVNVPIGIAIIAVAWRIMPHDEHTGDARGALDLGGVGLLSIAMLLFVLPLTIGRESGWPAWTIVSLIACAPIFASFVYRQNALAASGGSPLVHLSLFGSAPVTIGIISLVCSRMSYFALLFVLALYLQVGLGESALTSGLALVLWVACYGVSGVVYPRLPPAISKWAAAYGCLISACAFAGNSIAAAHHWGITVLILFLGCSGFGFGMLSTAMMGLLTTIVDQKHGADLSGVLSTSQPLSNVMGVALFGSLYLMIATGGEAAATNGFVVSLATYSAVSFIGAFLAWLAIYGSSKPRSPSSSSTGMPSDSAFTNLEPASSPATT